MVEAWFERQILCPWRTVNDGKTYVFIRYLKTFVLFACWYRRASSALVICCFFDGERHSEDILVFDLVFRTFRISSKMFLWCLGFVLNLYIIRLLQDHFALLLQFFLRTFAWTRCGTWKRVSEWWFIEYPVLPGPGACSTRYYRHHHGTPVSYMIHHLAIQWVSYVYNAP